MAWNPTDGITNYQVSTAVPAASTTTSAATPTATAGLSSTTAPVKVQNATNTLAATGLASSTTPAGMQNATNYNSNYATSANVNPLQAATSAVGTALNQNRNLNGNELVSNQIASITASDSPLMQRAAATALRNANQRGLLNSTMANEAALGAVLDRATPIAQSNASAYTNVYDRNLANNQQTAIFNAGQMQNNNQFNAGQRNQIGQFNNTQQQQNNQFNAGQIQNNNQFNANNANQNSQFNAGNFNRNQEFNTNLNQQNNQFNAGQTQQSNQFNANNANQISQFNANNTNQANQFNANLLQNNNQFNASNQQQVNLQNANNALQNNQFNATEANKSSIFNASESNKVLSQFLDQSNKLQLADIEATYKTIMQSEASAGQLYQQSIRNISDILQNPDLTPEAKTAAVNNQNALLKTGMQLIGKIGGLNLDNLLVFPRV